MSRPVNEIDSVFESTNILRNLTIENIEKNDIFSFDEVTNKDYRTNVLERLFNIKKERIKIIDKIIESGGILTGSKVLSKTYLYGKKVLERSSKYSDWDFLVTEKMAYKISSEIDFKEKGDKLSIRVIDDMYESGEQYIDLILVKSLPNHYKVGKFLYTDPISILYNKIEMVKSNNISYSYKSDKNADDMKSFLWKFNYLLE